MSFSCLCEDLVASDWRSTYLVYHQYIKTSTSYNDIFKFIFTYIFPRTLNDVDTSTAIVALFDPVSHGHLWISSPRLRKSQIECHERGGHVQHVR